MIMRYRPALWRRQAELEAEATRLIRAADRRQSRSERRRSARPAKKPETPPRLNLRRLTLADLPALRKAGRVP